MGYWIFMFILTLLIPASLLFTWKLCPTLENIDKFMGYRTSRSMKNQNTWDFAQKHCAKISLHMFLPSLILAVIVMPFVRHKSADTIGWAGLIIIIIQMISFIVIIVSTERALKKNFDENGNRYKKSR